MKTHLIPVAFLLLCSHASLSQDSKYFAKVIPPSPTSTVFNQYGNHQPSLASGTVNIPIPLFEIKADNFTLPFTLTYNTSGINVFDRPYPAGYGWVFSPGLRVTRTIMGRTDERYPYVNLNGEGDYEFLKRAIIDEQYIGHHGISTNQLYDSQKDIFTAHLPSGSHSFLIEKVGTAYEAITVGNLLRIEFIGELKGIKITDENGVVYTFGMLAHETVINNYVEIPGNNSGCTGWMLREVTLPNNEKINFTWQQVNVNNYAVQTTTPISIKDYKSLCCGADPNPEVTDMGGVNDYANYAYANVKMLEKVEFPLGVINISYKSASDPFMTKFEVRDKSNVIRRTVNFTYGETGAQLEHTLLKTLTVDQEVYRFAYNGNRFGKNSTGLDYWGYYNGKNNVSLIPRMRLRLFNTYTEINSVTPNAQLEVGNADRSVDNAAMKAFMLTRITYPTGGYSDFEYEPHQFTNRLPASTETFATLPEPINKGGGLRLASIITKADAAATPVVKTYKYGANENGMANITTVPTLDTFIDEFWRLDEISASSIDIQTYRVLSVNALSNYSKYLVNTVPIWYGTVTEYVNDHKVEYKFQYDEDGANYALLFKLVKKPYLFYYMGLFQNGPRMEKQVVYKKNGSAYAPLEQTVLGYEAISHSNLNYAIINSEVVDRKVIFSSYSDRGPDLYSQDLSGTYCNANGNAGTIDASNFAYNNIPYRIHVRYPRLKSKQMTSFIEGGSNVVKTEEYAYNMNYRSQIQKVTKSTSNAAKDLINEYKYPHNYTAAVYITMKGNNMVAPVVEEITYHGTSEIQRVKTNYTNSSAITTGLIRPLSVQTSTTGAGGLRTEVSFDSYDTKGNLRQYTAAQGTPTGYLWGYGGQYPIAEVINASHADIAYTSFEEDTKGGWSYTGSAVPAGRFTGRLAYVLSTASPLSKGGLSTGKTYELTYWTQGTNPATVSGGTTVSSGAVASVNGWTQYRRIFTGATSVSIGHPSSSGILIDEVRLYPQGAEMTSYTYDPLVGMTGRCDPSGKTLRYEYDSFGRLVAVRDQDGNLAEEYHYHYRP